MPIIKSYAMINRKPACTVENAALHLHISVSELQTRLAAHPEIEYHVQAGSNTPYLLVSDVDTLLGNVS